MEIRAGPGNTGKSRNVGLNYCLRHEGGGYVDCGDWEHFVQIKELQIVASENELICVPWCLEQ